MLNMLGNGLKLSSLTIGVLLSLSGVALAESTVRLKPVINPAQVAATGGAHEILAAVKAQLEAEVSEPLTEVGEQNQSQRQTKSTQKDQSATAATQNSKTARPLLDTLMDKYIELKSSDPLSQCAIAHLIKNENKVAKRRKNAKHS